MFPMLPTTSALLAALMLTAGPALAHAVCSSPEDVVRAHADARSRGDARQLLALFHDEGRVFALPQDPQRLTGELSSDHGTQAQRRETFARLATQNAPERTEVMYAITLRDLVFAKLRVTEVREQTNSVYLLTVFRIVDCRIADLWHVARFAQDDAMANERQDAVISELVVANNAGDVERFLATFAPGVLHYRSSGDPHAIGDKPSRYNDDPAGRREVYLRMFANGSPAQVDVPARFTVGDLVVSLDVAKLTDGRVLDEVSIYRIRDGRITYDWLVSVHEREGTQAGAAKP